MELTHTELLQTKQKNQILDQMKEYVMIVQPDGQITYINHSGADAFFGEKRSGSESMQLEQLYENRKKNKKFIRFMNALFPRTKVRREKKEKNSQEIVSDTLRYLTGYNKTVYLEISAQPLEEAEIDGTYLIVMHNVSDRFRVRQIERDCAVIFASLIVGISIFLGFWSLSEFTLNMHLTNTQYTYIIEVITFVLFLEILFFSSFSMRQVGLVPNIAKLKKNVIATVLIAGVVIGLFVSGRFVMIHMGFAGKKAFMGGSIKGARAYIATAIIQEFLARGVMQTSIRSLMNVRFRKTLTILLTSLLFALMHMPFGFAFMVAAFSLSVALGIIFEKQGDMWGCAFLHWSCGYTAMCLFF